MAETTHQPEIECRQRSADLCMASDLTLPRDARYGHRAPI